MSTRVEEVLALAMQLPDDERRQLAEQLFDSVSDNGDGWELTPELREELIRRLKSIEDGTAVLRDGHEVMRELRAKLARQ